MENPFRFGGELNRAELLDREEEINEVLTTIRHGEKLFLIGPRRFGKTSILHAAAELGEQAGMIVLRFNVEAFPTISDLTRRLFDETARRLVKPTARAGQEVRSFFARLKPTISVDIMQQTVSGSLGLEDESQENQIPSLVEVLDGLEALAAKAKQPVGLILDEFQQLIELGGRAAEGQLRAAVQQHRKVGYVFAGSKTKMLTEMTTDHARPFYRLGARRFLGALPPEQVKSWLREQFAKGGFKVSEEIAETIITRADNIPYDIQLIAHTCWNLLLGRREKTVTAQHLDEVIDMLIRKNDPLYNSVWNQLSPNQKNALIAVLNEGGQALTSAQVLKKHRLAAATMQKSLGALRDKGILQNEERFGSSRWRFEDPVFGKWLKYQLGL